MRATIEHDTLGYKEPRRKYHHAPFRTSGEMGICTLSRTSSMVGHTKSTVGHGGIAVSSVLLGYYRKVSCSKSNYLLFVVCFSATNVVDYLRGVEHMHAHDEHMLVFC